MSKLSTQNFAIMLIALMIGGVGGYLIQYNNMQKTIQSQSETIDAQTDTLAKNEQQILDLEEAIREYNLTIKNKLTEIETLQSEITDLIEAQGNIPNLLEEKDEKIKELEEEIQEYSFEIIKLKGRLGDRLNWKTYTKYDFSFEYPEEMNLSVIDEGYDSGTLMNIKYFEPVNYLYFSWINLSQFNHEEVEEEVEKEHDELSFETSNIIETRVAGHEAYIYIFSIEVGDGAFHGVMCTWYCQNTGRVFVLFQYSSGDPITSFINILDTIKCHSLGDIV